MDEGTSINDASRMGDETIKEIFVAAWVQSASQSSHYLLTILYIVLCRRKCDLLLGPLSLT